MTIHLDLAACQPESALSHVHRQGAWLTVPFRTSDGHTGAALYAGTQTGAPPVTLQLRATGWHHIRVGLWSNWTESTVRLKLTGDPAFHAISRTHADNFAIDDLPWRTVDLTGQDLVIAQQSNGLPQAACLAYVSLVPAQPPDGAPLSKKPMIAMDDAFTFFYRTRPTSQADVWDELQPYLDTDFTHVFWGTGIGGDLGAYPSDVLSLAGQLQSDFPRPGDRNVAESLSILRDQDIDPLAAALELAHAGGLAFHVGHRMESFQMCPPFDAFFTGDLWREHPEWRCRDRDRVEIARLSYAFDGVQQHVLDVFQEILDRYEIDGINPLFNRGAPYLLYEEPLIAKYPVDPRTLDEHDAAWLRFRAETMTGFMRRLRRLVDAASARRGTRLEISPHVLNDLDTNLFYGLDIETWIREGLVDRVIAFPWRDQPVDTSAFVDLTRGTRVAFFQDVMPRFLSAAAYQECARDLFDAGVDGLCFWDTDQRAPRLSEWCMLRRLSTWASSSEPEPEVRRVPLESVAGMRIDRYPPHWAF